MKKLNEKCVSELSNEKKNDDIKRKRCVQNSAVGLCYFCLYKNLRTEKRIFSVNRFFFLPCLVLLAIIYNLDYELFFVFN